VNGDDEDDNIYLRQFRRLMAERTALHAVNREGQSLAELRRDFVRRYAFAIPTSEALAVIRRHSPIIELGAGTGYWAFLLRRLGVDVLAFDLAPPDRADNFHKFRTATWTNVELGGAEQRRAHANRALFLCWPSQNDPFANDALRAYAGATCIYVGEPHGGHTASDAFFHQLENEWARREHVQLPNWPGTNDALYVYARKPVKAYPLPCPKCLTKATEVMELTASPTSDVGSAARTPPNV
jgi:hypothetical protein